MIDKERGALIPRDLVKAEWVKHIGKLFEILDKSLDRGIYNAVAKELKSYLRDSSQP